MALLLFCCFLLRPAPPAGTLLHFSSIGNQSESERGVHSANIIRDCWLMGHTHIMILSRCLALPKMSIEHNLQVCPLWGAAKAYFTDCEPAYQWAPLARMERPGVRGCQALSARQTRLQDGWGVLGACHRCMCDPPPPPPPPQHPTTPHSLFYPLPNHSILPTTPHQLCGSPTLDTTLQPPPLTPPPQPTHLQTTLALPSDTLACLQENFPNDISPWERSGPIWWLERTLSLPVYLALCYNNQIKTARPPGPSIHYPSFLSDCQLVQVFRDGARATRKARCCKTMGLAFIIMDYWFPNISFSMVICQALLSPCR